MDTYTPQPIDTSNVPFPEELRPLVERLAEHNHDIWARQRIGDGWRYGPARNDALKQHPCLVPYAELPEAEKTYDRQSAMETIRAVLTLGYRVNKPRPSTTDPSKS
ncbi:MAG: RyR domain-containing protein [Gammaproteobacteria bacterium]